MSPMPAFAATAATWQNFYLLVGTAAATLIGLMFVAVTFGASLMTAEASPSARAWLDPPFAHFVTVLFTAAVMVSPLTSALPIAAALLIVPLMRSLALVRVYRRMREAHARYQDIELSDWMSGVVLPLVCYMALLASGAGFVGGYPIAFAGLAAVIVVILLLGVFGAWELMMWLALTRLRRDAPPGS